MDSGFHRPKLPGFRIPDYLTWGESIEVIEEELSCLKNNRQTKKKRKITDVTPKLYKPFNQSLAELYVPAILEPLFKDSSPEPGGDRTLPW